MNDIQKVSGTRLYILGNLEDTGTEEQYASNSFKELMDNARKEFDYIIIDGSCVDGRSDVVETAKYADATVMVVKQNYQTVERINEAVDVLSYYGNGVIGCVFNDKIQIGFINSPFGYGYGYGYGYGEQDTPSGKSRKKSTKKSSFENDRGNTGDVIKSA
jgi:Mrp family chromosome partitioning ATPase